ncbi:AAA family ATPase [Anianabacter salinae]|uniref:AAA family ATPase n=1 Tax=Anianabacter salinae TaxID=2851023 RepID=UPI00225E0FB9|nr:AAA family ATPase [Anianabacter salinae]MBV0911285.1 AAA family ATPase [Anianabacter salinae]
MSGSAVRKEDASAQAFQACTVARDVQKFDLLIEDMEHAFGEAWGDLSFEDAGLFFHQEDARALEFVAIAIDHKDEANLALVADVISQAKAADIKVILIAEDVSPIALHQLLRLGAREFVPYPLPEGALDEAIGRLRTPAPVAAAPANYAQEPIHARKRPSENRDGVVVAVHGLSGGAGASTFAVNLAWELATISKDNPPRVCIIDLDLQFGTVSTYLDLPRRDAVFELLSDTGSMDYESFTQALQTFDDKMSVLTAPADILPLDIISSQDVMRLFEVAKTGFDYVIVDMPTTLVQWTETVLAEAHVYFAPLQLDMRSAQNTLRMVRALKSEDLPHDKLRYVLNRAPGFTDLNGKSRIKRMAESLDISIDVLLPDGGKQVAESGDHGAPLAAHAPKNALRKEIMKLAASLHELREKELAAEL